MKKEPRKWFFDYVPPKARDDELRLSVYGTTIFYAASKTDAWRQYREAIKNGYVPKRSHLTKIGMFDHNNVLHRFFLCRGRLVEGVGV